MQPSSSSSISRKSTSHFPINLNDYVWYWGNVSKDAVAAAMENKKDGTFMIREASTPGDFTLTLKVNGANKLIKILVRGERCGFTMDSLDFENVVNLVSFYRRRTLKQFNEQLDVNLVYPLAKPKSERNPSKKLGEEIVKCRLEGLHAEYERISRHYDKFIEQHAILVNAIKDKRAGLEAYTTAKSVYQKNIEMLMRSMENQTDGYRSSFLSNIELQKQRMAELSKAQALISNSIKHIEQTIVCMSNEIADTQPRLAAIRTQRDECRDVLSQRNASRVERFLKEINYILDMESPKLSSFFLHNVTQEWVWEPQWWLNADPSKETSNHYVNIALSNVPSDGPANGIFLIRPSLSRIGFFVLVITMNDVVHNCLIEYRDSSRSSNCGYGFHNTDMFFTTLIDFVRYYSQINLREHNAQLDTNLRCPALYTKGLVLEFSQLSRA